MPTIRVLPNPGLCPNGTSFEARRGAQLCESLLRAGVGIEHACDMVAACATCHIHVREGAASLSEPDDEESDELDNAWGLDAQSAWPAAFVSARRIWSSSCPGTRAITLARSKPGSPILSETAHS